MLFLRSLYLDIRFFIAVGGLVVLFVVAYLFPIVLPFAQAGVLLVMGLLLVDILILFRRGVGLKATRHTPEKFSNGDPNDVRIHIENRYSFSVDVTIIDEVPFQFQKRDLEFSTTLASGEAKILGYTLRPVKRGEYHFGVVNAFIAGPLRLARRRFRLAEETMVPTYPSYIQMRRYELLAISNRLSEIGVKKIRRVGHTMEFDQIREYVIGDDYRTVNWKATARRAGLMVNQYQDERSQPVISLIDKGRSMKMPFEEMTLLDYSINASLVLSNIALLKGDRAGLMTFSDRLGAFLPPERRRAQMQHILETLYNQKTSFAESDYQRLYATVRRRITSRSLVMLYTNFETVASMQRQLPYLRNIARDHLLVVIFFENTELRTLLDKESETIEEIYLKTIAEKFVFEKKLIMKELQRYGIHTILTSPAGLTINSINKYLEIKARRLI